jgi:alpha-amylase/alpha-mannosidase (GH57 family)
MLYLAFIFHMHQPYYRNLLTKECSLPWVRLHGTKDYLDMVQMLEKFPAIRQTFNLVPSLVEQIDDYVGGCGDKFLELSLKPAEGLTPEERRFILQNFFMINKERVISLFPRYYELYFKKERKLEFNTQDYLDLQVWFNLAWIDPLFRKEIPELKAVVAKARFFSEADKRAVLDKQIEILSGIIPGYKKFMDSGQIEVTFSPYYHPILPLLCNTRIAKEANLRSLLPKINFNYPLDAKAQIDQAVAFYKEKFQRPPCGMWPSEEAVSEHILPFLLEAGINWIVTDEAILFKSIKRKKRDTELLYQPHLIKREEGELNIIFRDRNLSDLIGFVYHAWKTENAVDDFMKHLEDINAYFKGKDVLVTIAMDGENAWEYYPNDGHDFLELLYRRLSEAKNIKTTTLCEYLKMKPVRFQIPRIAAGSWIYGNFGKWMDHPLKARAWECLAQARRELDQTEDRRPKTEDLAWKQIQICEGSDWFWWYGDNEENFDRLFRMHLSNFYKIIGKEAPEYLERPLEPV